MPDILLTTLNARYQHASLGLRYLLANLGELRVRAAILEGGIKETAVDVAARILAGRPLIVGIGVYIWNADKVGPLVSVLKAVDPDLCVVLGGPEVSFEAQRQEATRLADYVIAGEGDLAFRELCQQILEGKGPAEKFLTAPLPRVEDLALPYDLYDEEDVAHRVIHVEASRGCPFRCEFCLSALDVPLRAFDTALFLAAMEALLTRGVRHFKFVDRTFNLRIGSALEILRFFLDRWQEGMFLHFEMIPDRLPGELREMISKFPEASLQFEVGIQSFDPDVGERISRRQDLEKVEENFRFLREESQVHVHADLIFGLPGESAEVFGSGFDRLVAMRPQEIQVGHLKRLRGAPIIRHTEEWGMVYSPTPPYEVLRTSAIDFEEVQELKHFAKIWDLVANSGNFKECLPLFWANDQAPFRAMMGFSRYAFAELGQTYGVPLGRLTELVYRFLVEEGGQDASLVGPALIRDYSRGGRRDRPAILRPWIDPDAVALAKDKRASSLRRQSRHR